MNIEADKDSLEEKAGPHGARSKDDLTSVDDIGLPSGIQPEDAGKPDTIKPDPAKVDNKESQNKS